MEEIWKPIVIEKNGTVYDYSGMYEVSNIEGKVRNVKTGRILKQGGNRGYTTVGLHKNGKQTVFSVHRLVATMFIPNPDNLPVVNHINEDKLDNSATNLEWVTQKENINHGTRTQRMSEAKKGSKNYNAKKVICVETGQVFDTVQDACKWAGIKSGINACLAGKQKTAGGYHWMYYDEWLAMTNSNNDIEERSDY